MAPRPHLFPIAHELRTPLAKIRMYTEMLLLQRETSEDERMRWLESIEREACRLGQTVENLVLFADPPAAGDPFPSRRRLDLGSLVEDVVSDLSHLAREAGVRIEADPPVDFIVLADKSALEHAIANLVEDAIARAAPSGAAAVTLEAVGAAAVLGITIDSGDGEDADGAAANGRPGTGQYRLSAARSIAEAHGGGLRMDESADGRSRSLFSIPLADPRQADGSGGPGDDPDRSTRG
ncbi:MAG: HAMP domain-containing sensor histidine kinase [Gemmatimonadota bacterium]